MFQWDDITDDGPGSTLVDGAIAFDGFGDVRHDRHLRRRRARSRCSPTTTCGASDLDGPEFYALMLVPATGGMVMASANDLIVLFLGLEILSIALLRARRERPSSRTRSQEAGIKYFVLGAFSSAFFLYGIALVYGATGTTNLVDDRRPFSGTVTRRRPRHAGARRHRAAARRLGFKVAAVPFHMWTPDVYQGAPTPVTAFMASVGKAAAFAALLRVFVVALPLYRDDWRPVVWVLAVLSLVVGSVAGGRADRREADARVLVDQPRRLHPRRRGGAGAPGRPRRHRQGMPATLVYLLAYAVLVIGTFAVVTLVARRGDRATDLDASAGLGQRHPVLALALTVFLSPRPACRSRAASSPSSA